MSGIRGDAVKRAAESFALAVAGKMLLTALEVYIDEEVRGASHERLSGVENDWTDGKIHWWCGIMAEMHNPGIDLIKDP